jgi:hypothetical protein
VSERNATHEQKGARALKHTLSAIEEKQKQEI